MKLRLRMPRRSPEPLALRRLHALDGGLAVKAVPDGEGPPKPPKEHPHRRRRILAAVWTSAVLATAGLLLLLVLPTRAWLAQRSAIASAEHRLGIIQDENTKLQSQLQALQNPEDVEQVARQQYNLAEPGEKVFSVLPAPALTNLPSGWPFSVVNQIVAVRVAAAPAAPATTPTSAASAATAAPAAPATTPTTAPPATTVAPPASAGPTTTVG